MKSSGIDLLPVAFAVALLSSFAGCEPKKDPGSHADAAHEIPQPSAAESAILAVDAGTTTPASHEAGPANLPEAIAAQHVLVAYKGAKGAPKSVTRSKTDAKKLADDVAAKARAGTDFAELAKTYSDDPSSKERLGSLGKFTRDKMVPAFSDAAFALEVGQVSDPVETPFGFHVVKRNQ